METIRQHRIIIIIGIGLLSILAAVYFFSSSEYMERVDKKSEVVKDTLTIPNTTHIDASNGRILSFAGQPTPIAPRNEAEKILVVGARWTMKQGYEHVFPQVEKWSSDAQLIYIRSLGSVSSEGKGSGWQLVFGSKSKKMAKEIIIEGDDVVSEKDIPTSSFGFVLPKNWYDSSDAIISLRDLSQFSSATLRGMAFYANEDSREWEYALVTSQGTVTMPVK